MSRRNRSNRMGREAEKCLLELAKLRKVPSNRFCAECGKKSPTWCSTNLGVFVCIRCSGIHRNMGVHISKVKSSTLDAWTFELVKHFKNQGGNKNVNAVYEAKFHGNKPTESTSTYEVEQFVRAKYQHKEFYSKKAAKKIRKKLAALNEDEEDESEEDGSDENESEESDSSSHRHKHKHKHRHKNKKNKNKSKSKNKTKTKSPETVVKKQEPTEVDLLDFNATVEEPTQQTTQRRTTDEWTSFGDEPFGNFQSGSNVTQTTTNVTSNEPFEFSFDNQNGGTNNNVSPEQQQKKLEQSRNSILGKFKQPKPNQQQSPLIRGMNPYTQMNPQQLLMQQQRMNQMGQMQQQQMPFNQMNQMNQMGQMNQMQQMNQLNQMNRQQMGQFNQMNQVNRMQPQFNMNINISTNTMNTQSQNNSNSNGNLLTFSPQQKPHLTHDTLHNLYQQTKPTQPQKPQQQFNKQTFTQLNSNQMNSYNQMGQMGQMRQMGQMNQFQSNTNTSSVNSMNNQFQNFNVNVSQNRSNNTNTGNNMWSQPQSTQPKQSNQFEEFTLF